MKSRDIPFTSLIGSVVLTFACLAVSPALIAEEYYTWVDENGVTNYAQKKPRGYEAMSVGGEEDIPFGYRRNAEPEPEPEPDPNAGRPGYNPPDEALGEVDPDALIAEEKAAIEAKLAEDRAFNCDVGKRNLTRLEAYSRVKIVGEDGEARFMTPEEIEEKKTESRQLIRENCRAGG